MAKSQHQALHGKRCTGNDSNDTGANRKMTDLLCIHHNNCMDGFGAALAVKTWADTQQRDCEFIPAHYGDPIPDVTGKEVYIVDFSYSRDVLLEMHAKAAKLVVIDHHKTAKEALAGLDFCIFDMEKSGAVLTWEYFFKITPVPLLLQYIQDRDLWQFKLPNSNEVSATLQMIKKSFTVWDDYLYDRNINQLIDDGSIILKYQQSCIDKIIQSDEIPFQEIDGYIVPYINITHLISEIGNELAKGFAFCALYFETTDKRVYSLRSAEDGIDVSEIAKKFGGGGHFHAAGFSVERPAVDLHDIRAGERRKAKDEIESDDPMGR